MFTSYFANWRNFPEGYIPVNITRFPPKNWIGLSMPNLAPSAELLQDYKNNRIDQKIFKYRYLDELRERGLDAQQIKSKLPDNIIFLCYEKKGDFCHRHILAEWLGNIQEL